MRLASRDAEPPMWPIPFFQKIARHVFENGTPFIDASYISWGRPLVDDRQTKLSALVFARDRELGEIRSPLGKLVFLEPFGITQDELDLLWDWDSSTFIEFVAEQNPLLVVDLSRRSLLDDPQIARTVRGRVARDGSAEKLLYVGDDLDVATDDDPARAHVLLPAYAAPLLARLIRGRILHGRGLEVRGEAHRITIRPGTPARWSPPKYPVYPSYTSVRKGILEQAAQGTVFLDEIGEMDPAIQPHLLRALETREICRMGSHQTYQLLSNGNILREGNGRAPETIDDGHGTRMLAAGGAEIFALKDSGDIWRYCNGWRLISTGLRRPGARNSDDFRMREFGTIDRYEPSRRQWQLFDEGVAEIGVVGGRLHCKRTDGAEWMCDDLNAGHWTRTGAARSKLRSSNFEGLHGR